MTGFHPVDDVICVLVKHERWGASDGCLRREPVVGASLSLSRTGTGVYRPTAAAPQETSEERNQRGLLYGAGKVSCDAITDWKK